MAKEPFDMDKVIAPPGEITAMAQNVDPEKVDKVAFRRGQVRDLMKLGYEPHQIVLILNKGIKIGQGDNDKIYVPASENIIKDDIEYILQEDSGANIDLQAKKVEILAKLNFLYNQAMRGYTNKNSNMAIKNSFLNTALAILNKRMDLEGLKSAESVDLNVNSEMKVLKYAQEMHTISQEDKDALNTTISKILGKFDPKGIEDVSIPNEQSEVSALSSNDDGVSGQL